MDICTLVEYDSTIIKKGIALKQKQLLEEKRLVVMLNVHLHCEIKKRAAEKNMSIREWIEQAILKQIREEIELGFE